MKHMTLSTLSRAGGNILRALSRQLAPNVGTLVLVALLLFAYNAGAAPQAAPPAQGTTTGLLSYQGYLTNAGGTPLDGNVNVTFRLYSALTGGTGLWTEAHTGGNAVPVSNGLFNVLLGSLTPIPSSVWNHDTLYLGVQVGSDTEMTPREEVGAVPKAMMVPDGSITSSKLNLNSNVDIHGYTFVNTNAISNGGNSVYPAAGSTPAIRLISKNSAHIFIDSDNDQTDRVFSIHANNGSFNPPHIKLMQVDEDGDLWVRGSVTQGALIEANLQTPEESAADHIDRFSEGDVLCWSKDRLEKCAQTGNPLVQAVADENGKPIIIGAEVIKVLGPVRSGDLLVASDVPGYAIVDNEPRPGTIIAQALEAFEGERGTVKAMIRKF